MPLQQEDLDVLCERDQAEMVIKNLRRAWEEQLLAPRPSLWKAIFRSATNVGPVYYSGLHAFLESACCITQPVLLG